MGLHIPEDPGRYGWVKLANNRWKTRVKSEIDQLRRAMAADVAECARCQAGYAGGPSHAAFTWWSDESAHSKQCRSGCRWFNPVTRKMEGRAHCSCGSCFD